MSEYIEVGQPLQFTDPNTPTRVGEIVENVSDIYNIPSPRLGMQVFVKSEKKSFIITSLKSKVIGGVDVPEAAVEAFEAVGAKSITWNNDSNPSNMNDFVDAGVYDIKGEHTRMDDNLPILNTGGGHTFNARLTVLDSSISGSGNNDDKCITQVLSFSNRLGQGEVYIRTGKGSSLYNLTWEKWSTLQRNVNVGQVYSLDNLIDNGIYSGVYSNTITGPGGGPVDVVETFVLVVINDYFVSGQTGLPRNIIQLKYAVDTLTGQSSVKKRVGTGNDSISWGGWEILNKNEIASMISAEIKKVTDGIDPNKIDSIKDIITWIEEHGDVANIFAAIEGLYEEFNREVDARKLVDNDTRSKGVLFGGFSNRQTTTDEVVIGYQSIDQKSEGAFNIPTATHEKAGVMSAADKEKLDNLSEGGGGVAELMQEVTYSELVALRDNASLVAGMKYRIIDYVTTTVQKDTKSANHPFDVIVEAVSENELSELAQAIQHEGDTYFDGNDLGAWQLWYSLDNDTDKYTWADAENGKGVIYRMIDEKRNDCPYDFKNILFYTTNYTSSTTSDKYYYTFSYVVNGVLYDGTVENRVTSCHSNSMGLYIANSKSTLNGNIFRNTSFEYSCHTNTFRKHCYNNTFGDRCFYNTFGDRCYNNTFGDYCYSNKFEGGSASNVFGKGCSSNVFGEGCYYNTFGIYCENNTLGNSCYSNKFGGYCYYNTLGKDCENNTLGNSCSSNVFGEGCYYNTFGKDCSTNKFGHGNTSNTFGDKCRSNVFGNSCENNTLRENTNDRKLDSERTSITLNEEYYDDGNNALVPIKHPDLSTQPSILPYKFMGQYVYEQLIPIDSLEQTGGGFSIPEDFFSSNETIFFNCAFVGHGAFICGNIRPFKKGYLALCSGSSDDIVLYKYIKIVYTSIPEEGDNYYNSAI